MTETKLTLRLPSDLHAALVRVAEEERRSLNAEILVLLEAALLERELGGKNLKPWPRS